MVKLDALIPQNVTVSISGSDVTTKVLNFSESGGEHSYSFRKTFGRRRGKLIIGERQDYVVELGVSITSDDFITIFEKESEPQTIIITFTDGSTGSYTVTYTDVRVQSFVHEMDAEGHLKGTINFLVPVFNSSGSDNRTIVSNL